MQREFLLCLLTMRAVMGLTVFWAKLNRIAFYGLLKPNIMIKKRKIVTQQFGNQYKTALFNEDEY